MVTTSNVSTIQAGQYYNKDDYYSRTITQEDFWFGKGLLSPIGDDIPNPYKSTITPLSQDNYEQKINTLKRRIDSRCKKIGNRFNLLSAKIYLNCNVKFCIKI